MGSGKGSRRARWRAETCKTLAMAALGEIVACDHRHQPRSPARVESEQGYAREYAEPHRGVGFEFRRTGPCEHPMDATHYIAGCALLPCCAAAFAAERAVAACSSAGRPPRLGAQRLHGDVDDSMMLVDALEPDFYAKRGFDKSVDAAIVAAEIRQWLTNEGTPKELRTLTLLSTGNHVPKMIRRWGWQTVPDPAAVLQRTPAVRARGDDETPPVL